MDGFENMPFGAKMDVMLSGVGSGYIQGLVLKQQLEALRKEQKMQEMMLEAQVKKMDVESEALRGGERRAGELHKAMIPGIEAEALATQEAQKARSPLLSALSAGGPLTPTQEQFLLGTTVTKQPESWQKWIMDQPDIDVHTKASLISKFNKEPGKAEDVAMEWALKNLEGPAKQKVVTDYLGSQGKLAEALAKMKFGQELKTGENIRREGVKSLSDIHTDFRIGRRQLNQESTKSDADPDEISERRLALYGDYIINLRDLKAKVPADVEREWIAEVTKRWSEERKAVESRRGWLFGISGEEAEKHKATVDDLYAEQIIETLGIDKAKELLSTLGGGPTKEKPTKEKIKSTYTEKPGS